MKELLLNINFMSLKFRKIWNIEKNKPVITKSKIFTQVVFSDNNFMFKK